MLKPNLLTVVATPFVLVLLGVFGCNKTEDAAPPPVPVATAVPTQAQPAQPSSPPPTVAAAPAPVPTPGAAHHAAKVGDGGHAVAPAVAGRTDAGPQATAAALPTALPPLPQVSALPHPSAAAAALGALLPSIPTNIIPPAATASGKK